MPQIERPTYRLPLRDLPLSLFIHPSGSGTHSTASLLGKKRPISPSSLVSPSKRRLLAVEGVLSPRSPFKKAVTDLKRALPSLNSPARNLYVEFQRGTKVRTDTGDIYAPLSSKGPGGSRPAFLLETLGEGIPEEQTKQKLRPAPTTPSLLGPPPVIGSGNQPKPRVAAAPSKAEAELLSVLAKAPKPTMEFIPGAGSPRAMRSKEEDPEEVHYPGFDICADEEEEESGGEQQPEVGAQNAQVESMDAEDEDEEEGSKENQAPYVSCYADHRRLRYVDFFLFLFCIRRTPYDSLRLPSVREAACRLSAPHHVAELERPAIVCRLKWMATHLATTMIFSRIRIRIPGHDSFDSSYNINDVLHFLLSVRHSYPSPVFLTIGFGYCTYCSPSTYS
jgi:hypothetical protein